jgi:hypothetical protein
VSESGLSTPAATGRPASRICMGGRPLLPFMPNLPYMAVNEFRPRFV